jgi:hypothetical protein
MFDWNAELESAKHQVAELEAHVSQLKQALRQSADGQAPSAKDQRILSIRMASLDRAKFHERFIEHKIATGAKAVKQLPYLELAEVCFKASHWMPRRGAADTVRAYATAFYAKAVAKSESSAE